MAFAGSTALNLMVDSGLSGGGPRVWRYLSSDAAGDITGTGYFAGQGRSFSGNVPGGGVGMRVGDLLLNQETTGGATPGRVTWHAVTGSTANSTAAAATYGSTYGFDCSVSAAATT